MRHSLFLHIQFKVEAHDFYFVQKRDNANKLGLSSLQKITLHLECLRMEYWVFYGWICADWRNHYITKF